MAKSLELGRTSDDVLAIYSAPAGGVLLCGWIRQVGTVGLRELLTVYGNNFSWYLSSRISSDATQTQGRIVVPAGETYDKNLFTDSTTEAESSGWIGIAVQIIPHATSFVLRTWRKYGPSGTVIGPAVDTFTAASIGAGAEDLNCFVLPAQASDNGLCVHRQRLYARSTTPTNAGADTAAWLDWPCEWVAGVPDVADDSGNGRNATVAAGAWEGVDAPTFGGNDQFSAIMIWLATQ
jgi:hypothetical protein